MNDALVRTRLLILIVLGVAAAIIWLWPYHTTTFNFSWHSPEDGLLAIHFLDVGQGDAIFIESPTGTQLLIDGGRDASVLNGLRQEMSFFDRTIDFVLATHPDSDHISGLVDVLQRYRIGQIILTENKSDTPADNAFLAAVASEQASTTNARRGQRYDLGGGTYLDILFPDTNPKDMESNTSSIVARLVYASTSVMLTGDSPKQIEEYLVLAEGEHLKSDILKVGHHGSRTSSAELFLDTVAPTYAIISAGKNNRYGHPHVEVTDALFNRGVKTYSTAEAGTITFLSDGKSLWLRE